MVVVMRSSTKFFESKWTRYTISSVLAHDVLDDPFSIFPFNGSKKSLSTIELSI